MRSGCRRRGKRRCWEFGLVKPPVSVGEFTEAIAAIEFQGVGVPVCVRECFQCVFLYFVKLLSVYMEISVQFESALCNEKLSV